MVFACAAAVACGGTSPPPTPSPGPAPPGERITGNERLGWAQRAADAVELVSFHYAIYVDGTRSELADASCVGGASDTGFSCSARLPAMPVGAHALELAAFVVDGAVTESGRSSPLQVIVGATTAVKADASTWQSGAIVTTVDRVRLRVDLVADGLDTPTDIAFAPDGRIFVTERAGRVRVVRDAHLQAEPALALADVSTAGGGGLLGLAVDPRFESTRSVYMLYTTPTRSGAPAFSVARFREAHDTLADRVILLDDVPASPVRAAGLLRFGPDGKLYAAFDDGGQARLAGDLASFNGKILRMNADGSTPDDQAGATPVYSYEFRSPRGFDWHPETGALWVADTDSQGSTRLKVVAEGQSRPRRTSVRIAYALPRQAGASALAFYGSGRIPAFRGNLLIADEEGRDILRLRFDAQDRQRIVATERLLQDRVGRVRGVVVGPDGAIHFFTAHELGKLVAEP